MPGSGGYRIWRWGRELKFPVKHLHKIDSQVFERVFALSYHVEEEGLVCTERDSGSGAEGERGPMLSSETLNKCQFGFLCCCRGVTTYFTQFSSFFTTSRRSITAC